MWYSIPTNEVEQKKALKAFFGDDKYGERGPVEDLLSIYTEFDNQQIYGIRGEIYDKLYKAYQDAGMAEEKTMDELFPPETRTANHFRKAFETLWHTLAYMELYGTAEPVPMDADIEALLKVSDDIEAQGLVSHNDMSMIYSDLLDMKDRYNDAYYASIKDGNYDPVVVVENTLGNEAQARQLSEALHKGEFSAADYLNSRIQLLQQLTKNPKDTHETLFRFYDPRTLDLQNVPSVEKILAYDAELKAAKESFAAAQNGFEVKNQVALKVMQEIDLMQDEETAFTNYQDKVNIRERSDKSRREFMLHGEVVQRNAADRLEDECIPLSFEYNKLHNSTADRLGGLAYLVNKRLTPEAAEAAEKLAAYRQRFEAMEVKQPEHKRFDQDVLTAYRAAEDNILEVLHNNSSELLEPHMALAEAKESLVSIMDAQKQLAEKMKSAQQTPESLKEAAEQQAALTKAMQEQLDKQEKARGELEVLLPRCRSRVEKACSELEEIREHGLDNLFPEEYKAQVKAENLEKKQQNLAAMQKNLDEINETYSDLRMAYSRERNLRELADTFRAVSNSTERHWYGTVKKTPQVYQDLKEAMENYLQNKTEENAEKAYAECRNYLTKYMKADGRGLKHGSSLENARHQSVVRMLEIMEDVKEFQPFLERKAPERVIEDAEKKAPEGWEVVKESADARRYTKLSFSDLEKSLAKHSSKVKGQQQARDAEENRKAKAFSDLNKRIAKKANQNRAK